MKKKDLPKDYIPSVKDAEWFLDYWKNLPSYSNQEKALDKLFMDVCKRNDNIEDILIKCSSLNDFYSTNIFDIHINGKDHFFYSFATKYCSHHQPGRYAIYDSYVEKVLLSMNSRKHFANFKHEEMKDYETYMSVIGAFQQKFRLMQYNIKQLDQYLWQLGKWYFNQYGLSYKYYNREDVSPFPQNDIRTLFWEGEKKFVGNHQSVGYWKEQGKEWVKTANEQIKQLASKYTPEQFGVITYMSLQYCRHCPYDDLEWILKY